MYPKNYAEHESGET